MECINILVTLFVILPTPTNSAKLELAVYTSTTSISKLLVEEGSPGRLYVGCENSFIQLNSSLQEQFKLSIGPKYDTDQCYPPIRDVSCNLGKTRQSNTVKVLAINTLHSYIVMCGSLYQGLCSIHPLSDISQFYYFNETNHASYIGSKKSSTAFFGPPAKTVSDMSRRMLYAAVATYDRTEDRFSPRTISTREIIYDPSQLTNSSIQYFYDVGTQQYSYLSVSTSVQTRFRVTYLYGFELNGSGYYLSIQPAEIDISKSSYVTKLIQFCTDDTIYKTYVETMIQCTKGYFNYTIATAAFIQKSDKLAVSFMRAKAGTSEPDPDYGSVVCLFNMADVRKHFNMLKMNCSNVPSGSYPWWIYGTQEQCQLTSDAVSL